MLHPILKETCINLSETLYARFSSDRPEVERELSFVFSSVVLERQLPDICNAIKDLARAVEEESTLLTQDNLARGSVLEAKDVYCSKKTYGTEGASYWSAATSSMSTNIRDVDVVEYWGVRWHFQTDFIASTSQYPWMPSSVSKDEVPW